MTDTLETLAELRYEYQPTDDNGVNMGGPQVIKYTPKFVGDTEDLIKQLQENNVRLQRKLREANRKNKTGQLDVEDIPDTAPRFSDPVEFQPTSLSADDLIEISRDMSDPSKVESAYARLTAAKFGAPIEKVREALVSSQQAANDAKIGREVDKFLMNNAGYYVCTENWNTIYNWMSRYNLDPIEENFSMAFQRLTEADILLTSGGTIPGVQRTAPVAVAPVAPVAPVEEFVNFDPSVEPHAEAPVEQFDPSIPTPPIRRVATSLSNGNSSSAAPALKAPGSDYTYTQPAIYDSKGRMTSPAKTFTGLKAIDALPVEEYRRRHNTEPGFQELVAKLEKTRVINRNQR